MQVIDFTFSKCPSANSVWFFHPCTKWKPMKWICQERCSQCVVCALTMSFASCTSCQCYVKYFTRFTHILLDVEVFEAQKLGVGHLVNFSTNWACGGKYYYSRQFFTSRALVIFPTNAQCERNEVRVRRKKTKQ